MTEQVEQKLVNLGQLKKAIDKKGSSTSQSQDQYAKAIEVKDNSKYDEEMDLLCSAIEGFTDPSKDSHKTLVTADYANKQKLQKNYTALDCSKHVYDTNFTTINSIKKQYNSAYVRNTAKENKATVEVASDNVCYGMTNDIGAYHACHVEQKADKDEASVLVTDENRSVLNDNSVTTNENTKSVALTTNHVNLPGVFVNKNDEYHKNDNNNMYASCNIDLRINNTASITTDCVRIKKFFTAMYAYESKIKHEPPKIDDYKYIDNKQEVTAEIGIKTIDVKTKTDYYTKQDVKPLIAYLTLDDITMYKPISEGDFEAYFN